MMFDWDESNKPNGNTAHIAKHGVAPLEAEDVVLGNPIDLAMQVVDGEERFPQLGATRSGRILIVITAWRGTLTRVVTAFDAPPAYRKLYLAEREFNNGKATRT